MSAARPAAAAALFLVAISRTLAGQVSGTFDFGAGTYRPDRALPGGVASFAPTLALDAGPFRVGASGVYTDAPGGRWNFQGLATALARSPRAGIFHAELAGQVDWTRHYQARGTTALVGEVRAHASPSANTTLWLGRGLGNASSLGGRRQVQRSHVGTSARFGAVQIGFTVSRTSFDLMSGPAPASDSVPIAAPAGPANQDTVRLGRKALTDAMLTGRWRLANMDFDLALGRRFSEGTPHLTIWGVSASRSLTPQLALVAGAGRSGYDAVTSVPGSRYFVVGLRLKLAPSYIPGIALPAPSSDRTPFRIGPALAAGREVRLRAPGAREVEIAGDFTDWRPVALAPAGEGAWRMVLRIPAGLHRLAVRLDGGAWRAPPGARPLASEFGGEVAEIVVE
ncbi:MAG: hypothetical protein H0T44_03895 [Gemmatimonadales bacterium]|nr:hypothetical protein [Gemmatimonadales bacterium]